MADYMAVWLLRTLLVFPWLNPVANGPSSAAVPWLMAVACVVGVWQFCMQLTGPIVVGAWLLAALLSAFMGALQYFGQTDIFGTWVHATELGEAFANLRQRNQFATLTSIGLLALLWHVAKWRSEQKQAEALSTRTWTLIVTSAVLLALGNAASGSRTGLFQWLLVLGLTTLWAQPERRSGVVRVCAFSVAAYLLAVLTLPWLLEIFTGTHSGGLMARFSEEAGCSSRRVLWSNVLNLIAQKPGFGWGWGELDYAHFITLYPGERFCEIVDNAHNLPLHLAVELGVPVALGVCVAGLFLVWRASPWNERDTTRQLAWGVLAVILLHSMVEYPLWYGPFQMAAGLSIWLLWKWPGADETIRGNSSLAPALSAAGATCLIALIAYAGWDYWRISQLYLPAEARGQAYRDNTMEKVRDSWLFQDQVLFAELTTASLTRDNAERLNTLAKWLLHFSPEPRVVEKLVESAALLGHDEEALFYLQRYKVAFPAEHARWANPSGSQKTP